LRERLRAAQLDLVPPVPETDVVAFEARHQIRLPDEYRLFITEISAGGDGPGIDGLMEFAGDDEFERLAHPFPLTALWNWDQDPKADDAAIDLCKDGWLCLGHEGCTSEWVLIVTGEQRGQVWDVSSEGAQPCAPALNFLDWYELWFDWHENGEKQAWWDVVWADYANAAATDLG
jgi:hypothetical protein